MCDTSLTPVHKSLWKQCKLVDKRMSVADLLKVISEPCFSHSIKCLYLHHPMTAKYNTTHMLPVPNTTHRN